MSNVVKVWYENGTLIGENGCAWTQFIMAARDIHEQNLELNQETDGVLCLRSIRLIHKGEQLLTWYSPTLALKLGIPTLCILNICEPGRYRCLYCGYETGFPNVLKSHIKFHCNQQPSYSAAECKTGMYKEADSETRKLTAYQPESVFKTSMGQRHFQKRAYCACVACCMYHKRQTGNYNSGICKLSEFSKYQCDAESNFHCKNYPDTASNYYKDCSNIYPNSQVPPSFIPVYNETEQGRLDIFHDSLLELSTKRGHLCLYCGKFYSRKYGLKIHLRTHTGYKPLKCKICKRRFGDPSNLNKHVRLHADGDAPYKCKYCGKVHVRRRDLGRHVKSRHPELSAT